MEEACTPSGADCIYFTLYDRFVLDNEPPDFFNFFSDFACLDIVSETWFKVEFVNYIRLMDYEKFPSQGKKKRKVEDTFIVTDNNLPQSRDAYDLLVSILQLWFKIPAKFPLILFLMTMTIMNKER